MNQDWKDQSVSILESQIGYHPRDAKKIYLRSLHERPQDDPTGSRFEVVSIDTGKATYAGNVERWGAKWGSWWWVLDFSPVRRAGTYLVRVGTLESSEFEISETVFGDAGLAVVALDQLDQRIDLGEKDTEVKLLRGHYTVPGVTIWRDCASHYAEIEPVGTVVHGLADLHDHLFDRFSQADQKRIIDHIIMGGDYLVAAQVRSDDPRKDGRFRHSILVNDPHPWAGDVFSYHDMAYAMTVLARICPIIRPRNPGKAQAYLEAAVRAWQCATLRPYHLPEEFDLPAGCPPAGIPFWTPQGFHNAFARCIYDIAEGDWQMPMTLRTRDRMPFVWGSTILYEITGRRQYLDKAIEFADAIAERQFTDWENPIEGTYGAFHEFEGDDRAFIMEFSQGGHWWMGNIEVTDLAGFVNLLRLAGEHQKAATWYNVIKMYGEGYLKNAAGLSPLGIHPNGCYKDERHGGIKFFQNNICGGTGMFALGARTLMGIGAFLGDSTYQEHANANVEFVAGLNPGMPNAFKETAWNAVSLINGIGKEWFGGEHTVARIPSGAVCNGFVAGEQFWIYHDFQRRISDMPDAPQGMIKPDGKYHFNEDWIYHSHAYVSGVAKLEGPFVLEIEVTDKGRPVAADVIVELTENAAPHGRSEHRFTTDRAGRLTIKHLPTQTSGSVAATYRGATVTRAIQPINSGSIAWRIDLADYVDVAVECPEQVMLGQPAEAKITLANRGTTDATAELRLSASGATLDTDRVSLELKAGEARTENVRFKAGRKVMPYLIFARVTSGRNVSTVAGGGKVASKGT